MRNRQLVTVSQLKFFIPFVFFIKIEFLSVRAHMVCGSYVNIPGWINHSRRDVELSYISLSL